ncbi:MAG: trans-sulfuration enzyme family protein [Saprospiraceae bacterium]
MKKLNINSICSREIRDKKKTIRSHQLPIYPTSSFQFDNVEQGIEIFKGQRNEHLYSRYGNPTVDAVADKLATLETYGLDIEAKAYLTSSGMSAISTVLLALLEKGDKVLAPEDIYGGTTYLLRDVLTDLGIEYLTTDFKNTEQLEALLKADKQIKVLYFETPTNPTLSCVDIGEVTEIAQRFNRKTVFDNTFCTPIIQQPFAFGIDFIVHSTTKYLNGHGTSISGVVIGRDIDFMKEKVFKRIILLGTNGNPFDAWMVNSGIKTLALRMERHSENAQKIAEFLAQHPKVNQVNYPGLTTHSSYDIAKKQMRSYGGMLSFELKGGFEAGLKFMNATQLCTIAPTLGDVDTLLMHPASMSHQGIPQAIREKHGITNGLVRVSVGIEYADDLIEDIGQAMEK